MEGKPGYYNSRHPSYGSLCQCVNVFGSSGWLGVTRCGHRQ